MTVTADAVTPTQRMPQSTRQPLAEFSYLIQLESDSSIAGLFKFIDAGPRTEALCHAKLLVPPPHRPFEGHRFMLYGLSRPALVQVWTDSSGAGEPAGQKIFVGNAEAEVVRIGHLRYTHEAGTVWRLRVQPQ